MSFVTIMAWESLRVTRRAAPVFQCRPRRPRRPTRREVSVEGSLVWGSWLWGSSDVAGVVVRGVSERAHGEYLLSCDRSSGEPEGGPFCKMVSERHLRETCSTMAGLGWRWAGGWAQTIEVLVLLPCL